MSSAGVERFMWIYMPLGFTSLGLYPHKPAGDISGIYTPHNHGLYIN